MQYIYSVFAENTRSFFSELSTGIVGAYGEMSVVKEASLVTILPETRDEQSSWFFTCPDYLKEDSEIVALKGYLTKMMTL